MTRYNKRRNKGPAGVELNLAAMLDMAFQLLTFFILTFRPAPEETQVQMRLPPAVPLTQVGHQDRAPGENAASIDPLQQLTAVQVTVFSKPDGSLRQMGVGDTQLGTLAALERKLKEIFADKGAGFDQVVIHAGSNLSYESLMRVIDVCSRQKLASGRPLEKLSFAEASE